MQEFCKEWELMINIEKTKIAVQNYEVYFGLYPSSGINDKNSQRFGDWICLRPQVKPT
jgi:hypothetical protein